MVEKNNTTMGTHQIRAGRSWAMKRLRLRKQIQACRVSLVLSVPSMHHSFWDDPSPPTQNSLSSSRLGSDHSKTIKNETNKLQSQWHKLRMRKGVIEFLVPFLTWECNVHACQLQADPSATEDSVNFAQIEEITIKDFNLERCKLSMS